MASSPSKLTMTEVDINNLNLKDIIIGAFLNAKHSGFYEITDTDFPFKFTEEEYNNSFNIGYFDCIAGRTLKIRIMKNGKSLRSDRYNAMNYPKTLEMIVAEMKNKMIS